MSDPNQSIEDGLKKDGEFLRDVDKGMSSAETSLGVDLGHAREDAEVMAELQAMHGEAFVELGKVVLGERVPDEAPTPLSISPADMERLAHPGFDQVSQVSGGMERYLEENRAHNEALNEFFRRITNDMIQIRQELNDIRGAYERGRLQ